MKHLKTAVAIAAIATVGFAGTASAGPPDGAGDRGKPAGIECQQAGISTLQDAGLLSGVAKDGIKVGDAVALGVAPRDGLPDGVTLDTVLPYSLVLADHRAGGNSIFVYPWC